MHRFLGLWRRIKQCCWPTWVAFALASLAMILIVVPGDPASEYMPSDGFANFGWSQELEDTISRSYKDGIVDPHERIRVDQYGHGWPLPCMTRGVGRVVLMTRQTGPAGWTEVFVRGHPRTQPQWWIQLPSDGDAFELVGAVSSNSYTMKPADWEATPLLWSDYNRWPLATDAAEWQMDYLLLNLAVMIAIPLAVAVATEWWARRHSGLLRFRLVDLALFVVVCSLALAWRQSHVVLLGVEESFETQASPFYFPTHALREDWGGRQEGREPTNGYRRRYFGPDWMRRLIGNQEFLRFAKHVTDIQLVPNESWNAKIDLLPRLVYLESASFPAGVTKEAIDQLNKLPNLRQIQIGFGSRTPKPSLGDGADGANDQWISVEDLALLRSLPIEELGLLGEEILVEDVEKVISMPTLKRLEIVEPSITQPQLEQLRQHHPHVEITCVWGMSYMSTASPGTHYGFDEEPPYRVQGQIKSIKQQRAESQLPAAPAPTTSVTPSAPLH
jgi:hypothetical protein